MARTIQESPGQAPPRQAPGQDLPGQARPSRTRSPAAPGLLGRTLAGLLWGLTASACGPGEPAPPPPGATGPRGATGTEAPSAAPASPRASARPPAPGGRGDLLLVCLDTVRPDALGLFDPEPAAPFLASLAERAAVFEGACSTSSWTAPATASLLTGLYPRGHGVLSGFFAQGRAEGAEHEDASPPTIEFTAIPAETPTLAERLRHAGYHTIGVATNINIGPQIGFDRGFDRFVQRDGLPAAQAVERAATLVEQAPADRPWFLYLHLNDAHDPYREHAPWFEVADDARTLERERAGYASELGYLDRQLERLMARLALDGNAVVAIVSDHGEEFMEHGGRFHRFTLHGEVNRVLFLLDAPGVPAARPGGPVSLVDVAPTLLEACGLEVPAGDGRSLLALARAQDALDPGRVVFAHRLHPRRPERALWAAMDGRFKLIQRPGGTALYDLRSDPGEHTDVAADHPAEVERLSAALARHRAGRRYEGDSRGLEVDPQLLERLEELGYTD